MEFLVLDCDDCKADGERDPTQSVDQFIEYYFDGSSVLYKYSHKLPLLKQVDRNAGIRVIATCGQDPCSPVMDGVLAWVVTSTFLLAAATVSCVVMMYGRGALAWMVK